MITCAPFGTLPDGTTVDLYTIRNDAGLELRAITYGCIIVSLLTPDRAGQPGDVVLGHDTLAAYLDQTTYFGAVIGRYANRIGGAAFRLDGREYLLTANEGRNHLHGGWRGFDQQLWHASETRGAGGEGVQFTRLSAEGEEGYPGALRVRVRYLVGAANTVQVDYEAEADAPTVVNLTQHSYFNLSAGVAADILDHELTLYADAYTPVDDTLVPTGDIACVAGTPFDFRRPCRVGERIDRPDEQLRRGGGYDHNWVLGRAERGLAPAARLSEPRSGRVLTVFTTEPGVQFYSGNRLRGPIAGKRGAAYGRRAGLCLETQRFPDGPNHANFPSTVLRPGELFRSRTVLSLGIATR